MALNNDEELFVKKLYADSIKEKKIKDDMHSMHIDVETIMLMEDLNPGEKAAFVYQRKKQYFDSIKE